MRFISTRGQSQSVGFADLLLAGPAPDGGLYVPEGYQQVSQSEINAYRNAPYAEVACDIIGKYSGDALSKADLRSDIAAAYSTFANKSVAPLTQLRSDLFLLELFHGPTLAFKDIALQPLSRFIARALKRRRTRAAIVVVTSGDTGSAAIEAFRGQSNLDVFVLHPHGRISEMQRRQMTTVMDSNVHNLAVEGTFDDAQKLVKALFADERSAKNLSLSAVNSINFVRIVAQCVYYFTASAKFDQPATFVVPTGNFGNVFAGSVAARMGLSVRRSFAATNANEIVARAITTGEYHAGKTLATLSPAMDIQVASNFERALFEASDRDFHWVRRSMQDFAGTGKISIPGKISDALSDSYSADSATDKETVATIADTYKSVGILVDPHTAVGLAVARKVVPPDSGPVIVLATAHPAKFPDVVESATGMRPPVPPQLEGLLERKEQYDIVPNDLSFLKRYIAERIRPT